MYGYAPAYAQGGIASLAAKGRGGDSMLVHMSPDEVQQLQQFARSQGMTLTINPETGLPEAFKLRKLFKALATIAPIAAAFFPPLAAAMPFLTTPLGAGLAGGVAGGLSGDKGFDLKRAALGGALSYGLSSAAKGLQAAGGSSAAAGADVAAQNLAAQEAGIAGLQGVGGAPVANAPFFSAVGAGLGPEQVAAQQAISAPAFTAAETAALSPQAQAAIAASQVPAATPGTMTEGISNLLSSDAATRAAAQEAFTGQFGRGAMLATGVGAFGTMALDEQEKAAKAALEAGRISQQEFDAYMDRIKQARDRSLATMEASPWRSNMPVQKAVGGEIDGSDDMPGQRLGGQADGNRNVFGLAKGGIAALPPRYINGKGDGMSDSVPAMISNKRPARLADGEFVIPADVVSHLGNGSSKAGAKQLYDMMDRVRKARTGNPKQGKQINAARMMPV